MNDQQQQQQSPQGGAQGEEQRTVSMSSVIHRLVENSYNNLLNLTEKLPSQADHDRKKAIVDYLDSTREKFLRLLVLMKWSTHVSTLTKANQIIGILSQEDSYFRDTADELIYTKFNLTNARAPIYDIPTAIDVLTTGTYQRMPTDIKKVIPPRPLTTGEVNKALERLNDVIKYKLFISDIPKEFEPVRVEKGKAIITVKNEFECELTLDGATEKSGWVILSLNLFIYSQRDQNGEGPIKVTYDMRMRQVKDRIQNRIIASSSPLFELYNIIHYFSITSQLDILLSQSEVLRKTMIKNNIRIVNNTKDLSIVVFYWIPEDFNMYGVSNHSMGNLNLAKHSNFKISIDENQKLKLVHSSSLQHPKNENYFALNLGVTLESLLLKTIELHSYQKVLALYSLLIGGSFGTFKDHSNASHKSFQMNDIKLIQNSKFSTENNDQNLADTDHLPTVLRIKLYGSKYLDISVNFQNGKYNLIKSGGRDSSSSYFQSIQDISNAQEARLNTDQREIRSIVNIFKLRSLLACFEEVSLFYGFESFYKIPIIYNQSITISEILQDSGHIYTRLPHEKENYYLIINIQQISFQPTFYLVYCKKLDSQSRSSILYAEQIYKLEGELLENQIKSCDGNNSLAFQSKIQNILSLVIQMAKEKIHSMNITNQLTLERINYQILQNDKIQFNYQIQSTLTQSKSQLFISTDKMIISIVPSTENLYYYEIKFQNENFLKFDSHDSQNCHYRLSNSGEWRFRYQSGTDWITKFKNDLLCINKMANIISLIQKEIKSNSEQYPSSRIEIESIKPMEITLLLSKSKETKSLAKIFIKDSQKSEKYVNITFQPLANPLSGFFEKELNNEDQSLQSISTLLKSIVNANDVSYHIQQSVSPSPQAFNVNLNGNNNSSHCNSIFYNPFDLMVIPRSIQQIRIVYRNFLGFDIRLLTPESCSIEDSFFSQPPLPTPPGSQNRPKPDYYRLVPTSQFSFLMEQKLGLPSLENQIIVNSVMRSCWLVDNNQFSMVFTKILNYLSGYSIYKQLITHASGIFPKIQQMSQQSYKWRSDYYNYQIFLKDPLVELDISNNTETPQGKASPATPDDFKLFVEFINRKANQQSFKSQVSTAIVHMMTLPPPLLIEFSRLIQSCKQKSSYIQSKEICLVRSSIAHSSKESFYFIEGESLIYLTIRFSFSANYYIDLPLKYNYTQKTFQFWSRGDVVVSNPQHQPPTYQPSPEDVQKMNIIESTHSQFIQQSKASQYPLVDFVNLLEAQIPNVFKVEKQ